MPASFQRTITNELHELESLMNASTNFLEDREVDAQAVYRMNLGLEEMITNIIKHGYDDYDSHKIQVTIEALDDEIAAIIEDDGHEFNPLEWVKKDGPPTLDTGKLGGLGIGLIKKMFEHVGYRRDNGRNILELRTSRQKPS
ncbi:MAG: ATP-binding protein [Methylacidiphilales bacterium]|nr:ATP-binding protein [Candidatus Methylacidiphilales bacterium]